MPQVGHISESLEDYLKIIFQLERERRVARVKDIAARKGVRMASVTGALRRMSKEGLVNYGAREFVELTEEGAELARMVLQRAEFLRQFLSATLGIRDDTAEKDACALEHHLSGETLARMVALYQFMQTYGHSDQLAQFLEDGQTVPCEDCAHIREVVNVEMPGLRQLSTLEPGTGGTVVWLDGDASHRLDLVEKGLLPRVKLTLESHHDDTYRIRIKGSAIKLTRQQAEAVRVKPDDS
jgi:DtxR family Mn-dependent transcriptional regulator